eukprot:SAG22_NODE_1751_length_3659_cov_67.046067_5_plen_302_part_01
MRMRSAAVAALLALHAAQPSAAAQPPVKIPAPAETKTAHLQCGPLSSIVVSSAAFGRNCVGSPAINCAACGPATGCTTQGVCSKVDVTDDVEEACGGASECDYLVCIASATESAACKASKAKKLGDPAYGCAKEFDIQYTCSAWAWTFVILCAVGAAGYVGGGVAHAVKVQGKPLDRSALPHTAFWTELYSLALDGLAFSKGRLDGLLLGKERHDRLKAMRAAAAAGSTSRTPATPYSTASCSRRRLGSHTALAPPPVAAPAWHCAGAPCWQCVPKPQTGNHTGIPKVECEQGCYGPPPPPP